ncbi:hypothetical protein M514_02286 [Trichuris suis]|uniref:Helix-turn-helix domain-containing protein n=1 Tax=Trichuris suis TaxID=68888 RepID=A0A085MHB4_9BILA|nr:hypothetical protein M513_02286 [Trichuris suis]KFD66783.1 hypothetical protein M514_02286 [Trichuris suis]
MEKQSNKWLAFLDALIIKEGCNLKTTVLREPTHSDSYLNFSSHNPICVKGGGVTSKVDQTVAICEPTPLHSDLNHILTTLINNGHPKGFVKPIIHLKLCKPPPLVPASTAQPCPALFLPIIVE